jgi:hypothetical protein
LVAGVIGREKFSYDVWGDTVNTASRMESSGAPGRVNVSRATYELSKHLFDCEYRGRVEAKGKGAVEMFFVNGLHDTASGRAAQEVYGGEYQGKDDQSRSHEQVLLEGALGIEVASAAGAAP